MAAAQVLLSAALVVYLIRLATRKTRIERLPLDGPILAFSVWTLLSASFSPNPLVSYENARKIVLFSLLYLAVDCFAQERHRERILGGAFLGGLALGAGALLQYYFLGFDTANHRPTSFMGHYMTASGLLTGILVVAAARLVFSKGLLRAPSLRDFEFVGVVALALAGLTILQAYGLFGVWPERVFVAGLAVTALLMAMSRGPWPGPATGTLLAALVVPISIWALVLSRTRNAWLGALSGLGVLAILRAPRTLWILAAGVVVVLALRPSAVIDRLTVTDASSIDRIYMWQAGGDMIRDKPIFGQGPGMILGVYPSYRWPQAPNPVTPHLHDNALQIAAERGLPCVAWWLWWVAAAMGDAYREVRRGAAWVAAGTLALLTAMMVSGLFEYNFGNSEVLMLALIVSALPYALRRERGGLLP
jgi:O-antigen ligase